MRISPVLALVCGLPVPALAGGLDFATRDPACVHIATVQYLDCEVALAYSCPSVAGMAAPIHREEVFRENGLHRYSVATRNGAPLFTAHSKGRVVIAADPATLTETPIEEVIATGAGSFASTGSLRMMGMEKRAAMKVTLKVTGPGQAISGSPVVEVTADVSLQVPPPMGRIESRVKGYLMPDLGYYITGELMGGTFFDAARTPHRPMALSLPGSAGFQTTKPAYCGGGLGLLDPALTPAPALGGAA